MPTIEGAIAIVATLADEVLLQIRLVSDDLDGITLRELADVLIAFLEMLLAIAIFIVTIVRVILSIPAMPRRLWVWWWSAIASELLKEGRFWQGG